MTLKIRQAILKALELESLRPFPLIEHYQALIEKVRDKSLKPEKTAIKRNNPTLPLRTALEFMDFSGKTGIDVGSGKSIDSDYLNENVGTNCFKFDPYYCPLGASVIENIEKVDFVLLIYVLNVLPLVEREIVAEYAKLLIKDEGFIVLGIREDTYNIKPHWEKYQDGFITSPDTFQTFFDKNDYDRVKSLFKDMEVMRIGRFTWILSF